MRRLILVALVLPLAVPLAALWVWRGERRALRYGVPLDESQLRDAAAAGVRSPERVRLLKVKSIRGLESSWWGPAARWINRAFQHTAGITLQYGILVRSDWWGARSLVIHELVHVAQYERLGGIRGFLRSYLRECLLEGYPFGPLEQEAIRMTTLLMHRDQE